jgi:hypothetical protein
MPRPPSAPTGTQGPAVGDPGIPRVPARRCRRTHPSRPMATSPLGAKVGAAAGKLKVRTAPVLSRSVQVRNERCRVVDYWADTVPRT